MGNLLKSIFVCGVLERDSGKTTFSKALIDFLKALDFKVSAFKPLSGHSLWYQYDSFMNCISSGKLYSHDGYELWKEINVDLPIEVLNPVDILSSVPDLGHIDLNELNLVDVYDGNVFNNFVLGRFTIMRDEEIFNIYYHNAGKRLIEDSVFLKNVKRDADKYVEVNSLKEFLALHSLYYEKSVESCFDVISLSLIHI